MSDQDNPEETKPAAAPLPPGRGSPIVPGDPLSVGSPIPARTFNIAALVWVGAAVVLVILLILLGAALVRPR